MNYKELLTQIADDAPELSITTKPLSSKNITEVVLWYEELPLLNDTYTFNHPETEEGAYKRMYTDLIDAGVRRLYDNTSLFYQL